jgi:hypothetical protein
MSRLIEMPIRSKRQTDFLMLHDYEAGAVNEAEIFIGPGVQQVPGRRIQKPIHVKNFDHAEVRTLCRILKRVSRGTRNGLISSAESSARM